MRRHITLYIADQKVDLSDENLVLMNYALTDLTNPAVMRNSYSQTVTLPGTGTNDALFSHYFRPDHTVAGGYDPLIRVPFSIYDDLSEILAAGYCKLLRVRLEGNTHTYEVQLFGSLGEFIYGLAYDADGNKKTLASLDYLGGGDTELDFTINAQAVSDAWARLGGDTSKPAMWDVINFAPCLNGIPDGDFDAAKALAKPVEVGLTAPVNTYDVSASGYTLISFPEGLDEWQARDLRSYLQRPVISVKAFLEAIAQPANNRGWSVDLSDIDTTAEWPYLNAWITRPLLPSLGSFKQDEGSITATPSASATSGPDLIDISLANVPAGSDVSVRASFGLQVNLASAPGQTTMYTGRNALILTEYRDVWFLQAVGYAADNSVVAASPVTIFGPNLSHVSDLAQFAADCTFVPTLPTGQTAQYVAHSGFDSKSFTGSGTAFVSRGSFGLEVTGKNMASVKVIVKRGRMYWKPLIGRVESIQNLATLYTTDDQNATGIAESTSLAVDIDVTATATSSTSIRSGARITKQMLLSTDGTPADYLTSICKAFGLYILADSASKTAKILRRTSLYQNETIDLTERVDTSQPVELKPIAFDAKWYDLKHEAVGGSWMDEYKRIEGVQYGIQRIDTGYDFDAQTKDILDGSVLKAAASVLDVGRHWNILIKYSPNYFDSGELNKYIYAGGGGVAAANGWQVSDFVQCTPGETWKYSGKNTAAGLGALWGYSDANRSDPVAIINGLYDGEYTFVVPAGVYYLQAQSIISTGTPKILQKIGYIPTVLANPNTSYRLWNSSGESLDTDVSLPIDSATVTYYNSTYPGYDSRLKVEFRDGKNSPIDGSDVLVLQNGVQNYSRFALTDDVADMDTINGKPCWLLGANSAGLTVPVFTRFTVDGNGDADKMLDFGMPRQVCAPFNFLDGATSLFSLAWQMYLTDRLDANCKVMRCRVRLDGLQVGPELLRKFYWYRDSLWVLNKISNYSLTTFDLAECEFIQVRDTDAYLNGQY